MRSPRPGAPLLGVVLCLLAVSGCNSAAVPAPAPTTPPPSSGPDRLSEVRWSDHVRNCAKENGGPGLGTVINTVLKGDATGDGKVDTLVVDQCDSTTSSWPQVVEVFDGASDPANPTRVGALLDGDPDYVRDVAVMVEPGGRVVITGDGLSDAAPRCCPDLAVRKVFTFHGNSFTVAENTASPR